MTCPLGTSEEEDQVALCWELYYDDRRDKLEGAMDKLKRINGSTYHRVRREMMEIDDAETY